jgi:iron complex transport system substrate-binding protein
MRRRVIDLVNGGAAAGAVLVVLVAAWWSEPPAPRESDAPKTVGGAVRIGPRGGLIDARGREVPLRRYRRVVSTSIVADRLLVELCEPERVVAFSVTSRKTPRAYQFAGKPGVGNWADAEAYLARKPDLVLIAKFARPNLVERLTEAGVTVFDLGSMRGKSTLIPAIHAVGYLVGRPEAARRLARRFERRMRAVARGLPAAKRRTAIYVGILGDKLIGGTRGSSFHDVLTHGGLVDLAAERYRGWPHYTAEQVLQLDPEVIVTRVGMRAMLCRHAALGRLQACAGGGRRVLELPSALLADPGLGMLDAAETVYDGVYGEPR